MPISHLSNIHQESSKILKSYLKRFNTKLSKAVFAFWRLNSSINQSSTSTHRILVRITIATLQNVGSKASTNATTAQTEKLQEAKRDGAEENSHSTPLPQLTTLQW